MPSVETTHLWSTWVAAPRRPVASWPASSSAARDDALRLAADLIEERAERILEANAADVDRATEAGADATSLDRLRLDAGRVAGMAVGLRDVAGLPDPVGEVVEGWVRPNGLRVERVRIPLGVIGIIYENRPNVTSDAAGLCLKSGNAVLLRGSSTAIASNMVIAAALRDGLAKAGLPADAVGLVEDTSRASAVGVHAARRAVIDCLIPRGGASLIASIERARHRALRDRRDRQLPRLRRRGGRPRHGRVDRGQRQDPAARGVQRRRVAGRAPGGGRRVPAPDRRRPRRGDPAGRRGHPGDPARASERPPSRTSPPSSSARP